VLSKHGSRLVPCRDEEAAGFSFCHPDHSRRSLTCENGVSCALCSIPQRSPQRPRGNKWNAGATATGRRTPGRPARRSRPRGTAGSLQGTVIPRQQRRGLSGRDVRRPGITDDPKSASSSGSGPSPTLLGADPVDPSVLNSTVHVRACFVDRLPSRKRIVRRDGPGDSQHRPSADRNSPAGGSLIRTDGLKVGPWRR